MLEIRMGGGRDGRDSFARLIGVLDDLDIERAWPVIVSEVIHPFMLAHSKRQFATDGRHGGAPWADYSLEPIYAAYKLEQVGHLDLLRWDKNGRWEQVYPSLTDPSHPEHVYRVGRNSVAIGSSVEHAIDLTRDTEGPFEEPSPGREILAMRGSQRKGLTTDIQRFIRREIGKSGKRIVDVRQNL
jgi:hypothetical protein